CAPRPSVFCGNAPIDAFIAASMSCHDIVVGVAVAAVVAVWAALAGAAASAVRCILAVMPASLWPGTWQRTVKSPGSSDDRSRCTVWRGATNGDATDVP